MTEQSRIYHFDDDFGKWAVYEKISPYFKDLDGCIKWSAKEKRVKSGKVTNEN